MKKKYSELDISCCIRDTALGKSVLVSFDVFFPKEQLPSYFLPYRKMLKIEWIKLLCPWFCHFQFLVHCKQFYIHAFPKKI
jgi:hypothetical protein